MLAAPLAAMAWPLNAVVEVQILWQIPTPVAAADAATQAKEEAKLSDTLPAGQQGLETLQVAAVRLVTDRPVPPQTLEQIAKAPRLSAEAEAAFGDSDWERRLDGQGGCGHQVERRGNLFPCIRRYLLFLSRRGPSGTKYLSFVVLLSLLLRPKGVSAPAKQMATPFPPTAVADSPLPLCPATQLPDPTRQIRPAEVRVRAACPQLAALGRGQARRDVARLAKEGRLSFLASF